LLEELAVCDSENEMPQEMFELLILGLDWDRHSREIKDIFTEKKKRKQTAIF
jgi:hypothetical protein